MRFDARTISTMIFALGFALVSSGWSGVLGRAMSGRPSWSSCGQALCACAPVVMPEDCPLCALGLSRDGDGQACVGTRGVEGRRPIPIAPDSELEDLSIGASGISIALFLPTVLGDGSGADLSSSGLGRWSIERSRDGPTRDLDLSPPPPRG